MREEGRGEEKGGARGWGKEEKEGQGGREGEEKEQVAEEDDECLHS